MKRLDFDAKLQKFSFAYQSKRSFEISSVKQQEKIIYYQFVVYSILG